MTELVLHIGDYKTGSTSIQQALGRFEASGDAEREGLLYCRTARKGRSSHNNLAWQAMQSSHFVATNGTWQEVAEEIREKRPRQAVLSSEVFESAAPDALKPLLDQHLGALLEKLRIIVYVRPHFSRILSGYAQKVKSGQFVGTLDEFVDKSGRGRRFAFAERLERWSGVFGRDRLVVRPFVRDLLVGKDVLCDFSVHGLGRAPELLNGYASGESNVSPSVEVLQIVMKYTEVFQAQHGPGHLPQLESHFFSTLREALEPVYPPGEHKLTFSPRTIEAVVASYREDAAQLDEQFFDKQPVFVGALEAAAAAGSRHCEVDEATLFPPKELAIHQAYRNVIASLLKNSALFKRPGVPERRQKRGRAGAKAKV